MNKVLEDLLDLLTHWDGPVGCISVNGECNIRMTEKDRMKVIAELIDLKNLKERENR